MSKDPERFMDWHQHPPDDDGAEAERARAEFEDARDSWVLEQHPELFGFDPRHSCLIEWPCSGERSLVLEELDETGSVCAAYQHGRRTFGFGRPEDAVGTAIGRAPSESWVCAVASALGRDRSWTGRRQV
ncbi:MAG TPA: hypothetical protein VMD59_14260, partial [Acidimicrobiales bacterium]|nr:hypothetical protein [Acidimicrobiales bacterium]